MHLIIILLLQCCPILILVTYYPYC